MYNNPLFEGIDTIILRVADVDRSKTWYQEKLGLLVLFEDLPLRLVVMETFGPTSLTLWQTDHPVVINPETSAYPIFSSRDAVDARARLQSMGVQTDDLVADDAVRYFRFYDPDGNVLEACEVLT